MPGSPTLGLSIDWYFGIQLFLDSDMRFMWPFSYYILGLYLYTIDYYCILY